MANIGEHGEIEEHGDIWRAWRVLTTQAARLAARLAARRHGASAARWLERLDDGGTAARRLGGMAAQWHGSSSSMTARRLRRVIGKRA